MDINILIQRLQSGEATTKTTPEGQVYVERAAPTSTALQAARAIEQLARLNDSHVRVIDQLNKEVVQLNEQLQLLQSNNSSGSNS